MKYLIASLLLITGTAFSQTALEQATAQINQLRIGQADQSVKISKLNKLIEEQTATISTLTTSNAELLAAVEKMKPLAMRALKMPVTVSKRAALMGGGEVIQIRNDSPKILPVKVTLANPNVGTAKEFNFVLPAAKVDGLVQEIGHMQGWTAAPGDVLTIENAEFLPIKKELKD